MEDDAVIHLITVHVTLKQRNMIIHSNSFFFIANIVYLIPKGSDEVNTNNSNFFLGWMDGWLDGWVK